MRMATYRYNVPAGETWTISARGYHVRGMASDAPYLLQIDDENPTKFQTGIAFTSREPFATLRITNDQAADQEIELMVSDGPVDDNRLVGQVDISGGIRLAANRTVAHQNNVFGTGTVLLAAANTSRASLLLQNLGPGDITIANNTASLATKGVKVRAGESITLTHTDAVYAVATAASTDVRIMEETL